MHFFSPDHQTTFVLANAVLAVFETSRQDTLKKPEVGGQLFGTFGDRNISVVKATITPSRSKKRFLYFPNRLHEQKDIDESFTKGLHYLGDWHTHPESFPTPSGKDLKTMSDCYRKSKHELRAFLMIIVGLAHDGAWLWVGLLGEKTERLHLQRNDQQAT